MDGSVKRPRGTVPTDRVRRVNARQGGRTNVRWLITALALSVFVRKRQPAFTPSCRPAVHRAAKQPAALPATSPPTSASENTNRLEEGVTMCTV
jgi:hypothetical protein